MTCVWIYVCMCLRDTFVSEDCKVNSCKSLKNQLLALLHIWIKKEKKKRKKYLKEKCLLIKEHEVLCPLSCRCDLLRLLDCLSTCMYS